MTASRPVGLEALFTPAFAQPAGSPIRELFPYLGRPGMISFAGGYPSPSLFDVAGLQQAAAQALGDAAAALQYGPTEGQPLLREALLELCTQRGLAARPAELLVTTGSQQAFDLLVRVLVQPGDTVLVEAPAYPAALQALRLAGARIAELPMDGDGLRTDTLAERLAQWATEGRRPKLLYTVPSFSNPRGSLLPLERRRQLVALAQAYGFLVIEDDPYGELRFSDEVLPTLHRLGHDAFGADHPVVYLSSLSKTVAPALRVGWMLAPEALVRRCAIAKQTVDLCTSPLAQLVAAHYLRSGRYPATVAAARTEYRARALAMADALSARLGDRLLLQRPAGGMFLWLQATAAVDAQRLFAAAVAQGVLFVPGGAFFQSPPADLALRLSFAAPDLAQIQEGVARLARAFELAASAEPLPGPTAVTAPAA